MCRVFGKAIEQTQTLGLLGGEYLGVTLSRLSAKTSFSSGGLTWFLGCQAHAVGFLFVLFAMAEEINQSVFLLVTCSVFLFLLKFWPRQKHGKHFRLGKTLEKVTTKGRCFMHAWPWIGIQKLQSHFFPMFWVVALFMSDCCSFTSR